MAGEQKKVGGLSVGGSSILIIFVVLALTTFAALSLVTAEADLRLTEKQAESVRQYYTADADAEELFALMTETIAAVGQLPLTDTTAAVVGIRSNADLNELAAEEKLEAWLVGDTIQISYLTELNERQGLAVKLSLHMGDRAWQVDAWQIVSTAEWTGGENIIEVWDGTE
jgi:hypothetical protein